MNICYVIEYFYPFNIGGAEISAFEHAKELVKVGNKVIIITPNYGTKNYEIIDGVEIYRFKFKKLKFGKEINSLYFINPIYYLYLAFWVYRIVKKNNCDIVHAQNAYSIIGSFVASKLLGKKFFVTLRDCSNICCLGAFCLLEKKFPPSKCGLFKNLVCLPKYQKLYSLNIGYFKKLKLVLRLFVQFIDLILRKKIIKMSTKIITVSDAIGEIYQRIGFPKNKMVTVYNLPPKIEKVDGQEIKNIKNKLGLNNKKVVLYVGKMSYGKGTDVLIKAIPEVVKSVPDVCFVFVGRTNPLIRIPQEIKDYVKVLGHISNKEVQTLYELCDLVVIPSVWPEPYPRVALEAIAHNKKIVATNAGGISEIISKYKGGFFVERKNENVLAEKISFVLNLTKEAPNNQYETDFLTEMRKNVIERLIKVYSIDKN
ncbi:MAG: glycosyltransferase family 4 protein [Elusimicrobiota bacterium]|nr:glycosyltransferase family 4 protein [Endomicrobiia bacterium]MDW8166025.1 glycosyltransferase family 4 protein [Elusimicrobiota bacterium]